MNPDYQNIETIRNIVDRSHVIAVVGISNKPDRPSHEVALFLKNHGYQIVPVNPSIDSVLGEKAYPDLLSVPGIIDVVDIFRRSEDVGPIVDQAIEIGAKSVWLQIGVVNEAAADRAASAGLDVVMDRCIKQEYEKIH